jgi:hypothetical protein
LTHDQQLTLANRNNAQIGSALMAFRVPKEDKQDAARVQIDIKQKAERMQTECK